MRLAAGLRPDPLGELKRSPRPISHNRGTGTYFLGKGEERGKERGGKGREKGRGLAPLFNFWLGA